LNGHAPTLLRVESHHGAVGLPDGPATHPSNVSEGELSMHALPNTQRLNYVVSALAAALLLAACGGGDDAGDTGFGMSNETAQGYAADGSAMPVTAATGLDSAAVALEAGVAASTTADARQNILQAQPLATASASASCPGGGSVAWTVTGDTATLGNGQFDAGESYAATYTGCVADNGATLDGSLTLVVGSGKTSTHLPLTLTATNLRTTTTQGQFVLNGSVGSTRDLVNLSGGAKQYTVHHTSSGVTLQSTIGSRQASYNLTSWDWTVVRTYSAANALTARTHQGSLTMDASTPRRPNATLSVSTQGALTRAADGWAAAGSFVVVTQSNRITGVWADGSVTLTMDFGDNGTIDRTWTITRTTFNGEAG
jgi:hypothetical protein